MISEAFRFSLSQQRICFDTLRKHSLLRKMQHQSTNRCNFEFDGLRWKSDRSVVYTLELSSTVVAI